MNFEKLYIFEIYEKNKVNNNINLSFNKKYLKNNFNYKSFIYVLNVKNYIYNNNKLQIQKIFVKNNDNGCIISYDEINNYDLIFYLYKNREENRDRTPLFIYKDLNNMNYILNNKFLDNEEYKLINKFYTIKDYKISPEIKIHSNITVENPDISIVMSYFNRLEQINLTLKNILLSQYTNYEVIIVNDGDKNDKKLLDLIKMYDISIILINISPIYKKEKNYFNPCIPYNMAFSLMRGEKCIIQNPECCYSLDLISHVKNNLTENNYLSYTCYSLDKDSSNKLKKINTNDYFNFINSNMKQKLELHKTKDAKDILSHIFYNHPIYRPTYFHFTSAIYSKHIKKIGGFNEGYYDGVAYDDNEFLLKIKLLKLDNINVEFNRDTPFVIHQFHHKFYDVLIKETKKEILNKNKLLFEKLERNVDKYDMELFDFV